MFSQGLVSKYRAYFENGGPNSNKLGSCVDEHHTLYMIDLIFG